MKKILVIVLALILVSCSSKPYMRSGKYHQAKYHGGMAKRDHCGKWNPNQFKK